MSNLLDIAIQAHGGLNRWSKVKAIKTSASLTGAIWAVKGRPDVLKDVVITAETKQERLTMEFPGQDKRTVFEPSRIVVETASGRQLMSRDEPERSFDGQSYETPWDDIHVAYFSGEAMWTYLNVPFLYAQPGFQTEEISAIDVDGETWRRLRVRFPETVKSHTSVQISCFGPDGLLRRHDYTVDVLGGASGLNYAYDYRDVQGIVVPVTRRVYGYEGDFQPVKEPLLVGIDLTNVELL